MAVFDHGCHTSNVCFVSIDVWFITESAKRPIDIHQCVHRFMFVAIELVVVPDEEEISPSSNPRVQQDERICIDTILEQEETLFRTNTDGMRWPVVQLYRNVVIVAIDTFVLNPVFKCLWFSAVFMVFFGHDWYRMP